MKKITNIIFFLLLSSLAVGQNTLPMNVDTVFAKKNLKVGRGLFLMDTSYRKSGKVLSVDSLTGRVILVNNSAASSNVDSSKWERVNNKLQPKNTTDSVLIHKKLILDDYKNQTIEVPEYQTKIATSLSYNNIFNEIQAVQACDASGFTTLSTINTIDGNMYNHTPDTCQIGELSLNFPIDYVTCPGGYIDEVIVRTVGVSNTEGGYGTGLKVDGINTEYNGQPIYSDETQNAPFDYYFIDTTNRVSISSILATFFWEGTADFGLDGMEVILKIGGCENKYIVLSTDANGLVKLDTLPDFITADEIPTVSSTNIYNSDGILTDNRYLDGNGYTFSTNNISRLEQNVTNNSGNTNNYSRNPDYTQENINDNNGNYFSRQTYPTQDDINMYDNVNTSRKNQNPSQINFTVRDLANTKVNQILFSNSQSNFQMFDDQGNVGTTNLGSNNFEVTMQDAAINTTGIILTPTTVKIKTNSNPSTATTGQVLTLIDQNTGECDWADAGGGGNNNYSLTAGNGLYKVNDSTLALGIGMAGILTNHVQLSGVNNIKHIRLNGDGTDNSFGYFPGLYLGGKANSGPNVPGVLITGDNEGSYSDIQIEPQNGKLGISNLPTDNTATQVMGKDANGYSVWVDKSSISAGGSSIDSSIYNTDGVLNSPRIVDANNNSISFNNTSGINFNSGGYGEPFIINNMNQNNSSVYSVDIIGKSDISNAPNSGGINLAGEAYQMAGILLEGSSTQAEDIRINPINSKLLIANLNTDNSATQVIGKDANGYSVWVDKDSIGGGGIDSSIYNSDGTITSNRTVTFTGKNLLFQGASNNNTQFIVNANSPSNIPIGFSGTSTNNAGIYGYGSSSSYYGLQLLGNSSSGIGSALAGQTFSSSPGLQLSGSSSSGKGVYIQGTSSSTTNGAVHISGGGSSSGVDVRIDLLSSKTMQINSTGGLIMPFGTSAQRLGPAPTGLERFNLDFSGKELFDGTNWIILSGTWTTGTRPTGMGAGSTGFNTTLSQKEYWNGTTWIQF